MKTTKVVPFSQLPMRLPIWPTAVLYLLLDRFNPPGWVWGAAGAIMALLWVICSIAIYKQEETPLKELKGE